MCCFAVMGSINTTRWSEGLPAFSVLGFIGGFVTGSELYLLRLVIIGSNILSGLSRVGTFTTCCREGDRLSIGDKFNRLVSPAIMKLIPAPYFEHRK